jgi:hypothetical protein
MNEKPSPIEKPKYRESELPEKDLPLTKPPTPKPPEAKIPSPPPTLKSPPLFIKIEKYKEIIKNLRDIKSFILNLRDALDILEDIQKEISNGVRIAHKSLDELNMTLSSLDSIFLKPGTEEMESEGKVKEEMSPEDIGAYIRDVHGQLEKLKSQLKSLA